MSVPALRRLIGRFERAVAKNAEQRGKYPDDPTKYVPARDSSDSVDSLNLNPALILSSRSFYRSLRIPRSSTQS